MKVKRLLLEITLRAVVIWIIYQLYLDNEIEVHGFILRNIKWDKHLKVSQK